MSLLPTLAADATLLNAAVPLIDLRAPAEVAQGTLPHATSLPLMTDDERQRVGLRYQQAGQGAAIALGEMLVSGELRHSRLQQWRAFAAAHPSSALYCWRGGLRSAIAQRWLADDGVVLPRVVGGYKALRNVALQTLQNIAEHPRPLLVLGGHTGSGKTEMLRKFAASIDLEHLARHRGSAFGARDQPQPAQASFENGLACALLAQWRQNRAATLYEDEGRLIGRSVLPDALLQRLKQSALVIVEVPRAIRARHIRREYVDETLTQLQLRGDAAPHRTLADQLVAALARLQRRLGGLRHEQIRNALAAAFADHARSGDPSAHQHWIEALLEHYYDPMYTYQLGKQARDIVFRGDGAAVGEFITAALSDA